MASVAAFGKAITADRRILGAREFGLDPSNG
jgi:hypothetical protein